MNTHALRLALVTLTALNSTQALASEPQALVAPITLIGGTTGTDGARTGALHIPLQRGWHTYWRSPGETGIPPFFDWSASRNLKSVQIHWPRPEIFDTDGSRTLGYSGDVVIPITFIPEVADAPMAIALHMDLGVCDEICLPLSASVMGQFVPDMHMADARIDQALARAPQQVSGATCTVTPIEDGVQMTATLATPSLGADEVMVIEAGDPSVWVSQAIVSRSGATIAATSDLVPPRGTPFLLDRSQVVISVIGAQHAVQATGCSAP